MVKQLSLDFDEEWWMKVSISLSDECKAQAVDALKAMLTAAFDTTRTGGVANGQSRDSK